MGKEWYLSKTLWANAIALIAMVAQSIFVDVSVDWISIEAGALGVMNIALRLITKEPISTVKVEPE